MLAVVLYGSVYDSPLLQYRNGQGSRRGSAVVSRHTMRTYLEGYHLTKPLWPWLSDWLPSRFGPRPRLGALEEETYSDRTEKLCKPEQVYNTIGITLIYEKYINTMLGEL